MLETGLRQLIRTDKRGVVQRQHGADPARGKLSRIPRLQVRTAAPADHARSEPEDVAHGYFGIMPIDASQVSTS